MLVLSIKSLLQNVEVLDHVREKVIRIFNMAQTTYFSLHLF